MYREGIDLLPVISRAPEPERLDIASISNLQIWSPVAGRYIPLTQVVTGFETVMGGPDHHSGEPAPGHHGDV